MISTLERPRVRECETLGQQLQLVAQHAVTGRDELAPSGSAAGIPIDGGFAVQKDFATALLDRAYAVSRLASRARPFTIGPDSDGITLPRLQESSRADGSRLGGARAYWVAEADSVTATKPQFGALELEAKELVGLCYVTNRLLADAAALEEFILAAFSEEMAFKVDQAIYSGTGAGMPLGILNSSALITVSKEGGQAAATITIENIKNMLARLWPYSYERALWLCNSNTLPQLLGAQGIRELMTFALPSALVGQPRIALAGIPLMLHEAGKTLGTVGDLLLVDPTEYALADKNGLQQTVSMDVRFITSEAAFRFALCVDGQPIWSVPITPYIGSATQSPYIALETRS